MAYGALIMYALTLLFGKPFAFNTSFEYLSSFLYLALFGSVIAFYCYFTLIGNIGADKAAYIPVAVPVIALTVSTLFEGYQWTFFSVLGIILIIAGNLLVINRKTLLRVN
jgi:drug/metabolite transporter (DMT)-like permease